MTRSITVRVPQARGTTRLDELLNETIPAELTRSRPDAAVSRSKIRRLIVAGAVSVNGRQERRPAASVSAGCAVTVRLDEEKLLFEKTPDDIEFEMTPERILFEDESIIVVNKPAGLPTEATMVADRDNLHAALKRYLLARDKTRNEPYVGLHHRLDRETSGVILFTKARADNAAVHDMFLGHRARKEYEALASRTDGDTRDRKTAARNADGANGAIGANGNPFAKGSAFTVENMLGRISSKSQAGKWGELASGGDPARTDFRILGSYREGYRILAMPVTGRTHQIRVHLSGCGLPILGDALYGGPRAFRDGTPIRRVMLHAARLSFPHPATGMELTVEAPLPEDFLGVLASLAEHSTN